MKLDPYLKPGTPCEVWDNNSSKKLLYFSLYYTDGKPRFLISKINLENGVHRLYDNYRPLNTEWDYAPDWAVCSTVDEDGGIRFWAQDDDILQIENEWIDQNYGHSEYQEQSEFICPDKSRYEGVAWKTSLRMRPDWAQKDGEDK